MRLFRVCAIFVLIGVGFYFWNFKGGDPSACTLCAGQGEGQTQYGFRWKLLPDTLHYLLFEIQTSSDVSEQLEFEGKLADLGEWVNCRRTEISRQKSEMGRLECWFRSFRGIKGSTLIQIRPDEKAYAYQIIPLD